MMGGQKVASAEQRSSVNRAAKRSAVLGILLRIDNKGGEYKVERQH